MKQARALRRVVIKEEFIALAGDHVSAVLLSQIEYWTKHSRDLDKYLAEEKRRASKDGRELDVALTHGWIYKTAQDLSEETMMNMSPSNIRMRLKKLIKRGWISERNNPDHKCRFRPDPDARSVFGRPPVPANAGHLFQSYRTPA